MTQPESNYGPAAHPGYYAPVQGYAPMPGSAVQVPAPYAVNVAVRPHRLVPPGGRLGAALLDVVLMVVTLGVGWWIWALVTWSNGQTPAKSLLGHVVVDGQTGEVLGWGRMFVRNLVIRMALFGLLDLVTLGVFTLVNVCMVFRGGHRTFHDQLAGSAVRYVDPMAGR